MGYFSNGTEGMLYQEEYCDRCEHDVNEDCAVWLLHLMHSYELCNTPNNFLDALIPRNKEGCYNEKCKMFTPRRPEHLMQDMFEGCPRA
jgi:hypothetical protein